MIFSAIVAIPSVDQKLGLTDNQALIVAPCFIFKNLPQSDTFSGRWELGMNYHRRVASRLLSCANA